MPWWWWPLGIGFACLMAAQVHMGYPGLRAWLPYLLTVPPAVAVLIWLGRRRVRVVDAEMEVGAAHVPLHHLGAVTVIPPGAKSTALGPNLDPAAFLRHSAWVGPLVRVEVTDPQDPTPYWIFSVRRADELAALLNTEISSLAHDDSLRRRSPGTPSARRVPEPTCCDDAPGNSSRR